MTKSHPFTPSPAHLFTILYLDHHRDRRAWHHHHLDPVPLVVDAAGVDPGQLGVGGVDVANVMQRVLGLTAREDLEHLAGQRVRLRDRRSLAHTLTISA